MTATGTADEKREAHVRGIKVTAFASTMGILAGVLSWALTQGIVGPGLAETTGIYVLAGSVVLQRPVIPLLGKDEMGAKDWLYVAFMTFDLWFVSWTVLLTG